MIHVCKSQEREFLAWRAELQDRDVDACVRAKEPFHLVESSVRKLGDCRRSSLNQMSVGDDLAVLANKKPASLGEWLTGCVGRDNYDAGLGCVLEDSCDVDEGGDCAFSAETEARANATASVVRISRS